MGKNILYLLYLPYTAREGLNARIRNILWFAKAKNVLLSFISKNGRSTKYPGRFSADP